jgi:hypothetical protein
MTLLLHYYSGVAEPTGFEEMSQLDVGGASQPISSKPTSGSGNLPVPPSRPRDPRPIRFLIE